MGTIARGVVVSRTDDSELTVLRHCDLRRATSEPRMLVDGVSTPAPELDAEKEFVKVRCGGECRGRHNCTFYRVAERATESFYFGGSKSGAPNKWVFDQARMDLDDVRQYGLTYGVNFVGNYLRPPDEDVDDDNAKRLHCHVIQRLQQLRAHLFKERKNSELPDATGPTNSSEEREHIQRQVLSKTSCRAAQLWGLMYGSVVGDADATRDEGGVWTRSVLSTDHDAELHRHVDGCPTCRRGSRCDEAEQLQNSADKNRKQANRRQLASALAALTHPEALRRLRGAADNEQLCEDTRARAAKLAEDVGGCSGGCFLCKYSDVKAERRLRSWLPTLPAPSEWPQADDLSTVRRYVADVAALRQPFEERYLKQDSRFVDRYVGYRRHAARVLQLVSQQSDQTVCVTALGRELLLHPPESREERSCLRGAALGSPILESVRWYFEGTSEGEFDRLIALLVGGGLEADSISSSVSGRISVAETSRGKCLVVVTPEVGRVVRYTAPVRRLLVKDGDVVEAGQVLTATTEGTARRRARTLRSWRNYFSG